MHVVADMRSVKDHQIQLFSWVQTKSSIASLKLGVHVANSTSVNSAPRLDRWTAVSLKLFGTAGSLMVPVNEGTG